jgi:small subunit ribosomal protein S11
MAKPNKSQKKKEKKVVPTGRAVVMASFNNTVISIADPQGNVIAWSSAGMMGFRGARKSTPFAAQVAAENAGRKALEYGVRYLQILVKGPGSGRESALQGLAAVGFTVTSIKDVTPIPHNGCRLAKRRRV